MKTHLESGPVLELKKITVTSGGRKILNNLSIRLEAGRKTLIRGASGSGKSTLLNVILGGVPATAGEIRFLGEAVSVENIRHVRSQISFVGQEPILGGESARDGLLLPFIFKSHRDRRPSEQRIVQVLSRLGLSAGILKQPVSSLSGGEKQRIAIARAILLESRLFLLDEVTSALDPDAIEKVWSTLFGEDRTILAISHQVPAAAHFDEVLALSGGRLTPAPE